MISLVVSKVLKKTLSVDLGSPSFFLLTQFFFHRSKHLYYALFLEVQNHLHVIKVNVRASVL